MFKLQNYITKEHFCASIQILIVEGSGSGETNALLNL